MALTKRTDIESSELKGVVLAVDETKTKPGIFQQLTNWKPSGIGSIKKKRGVVALTSAAITPILPTEDCTPPTPTPPSAPSLLVATVDNQFQITLTWQDNSADETAFSIERCSGTGCTNFIPIAVVLADIETYVDDDLEPDTEYSYRILAYNSAGGSGYSNTATATTTALPLEPPDTDLMVWLDASQILGFVDGDPLDQFDDQSGEANNFIAVGSARPIYKTTGPDIINGLPVVVFDGVDDLMTCAGLDTSGWTSATIFVVGKCRLDPAVETTKTGHWQFNPSSANSHFPFVDGGIYESAFAQVRHSVGDVTSPLDLPHLYTVKSAANEYNVRVNRVQVYSTIINLFEGQLGAQIGGSGGFFFNGVFADLLIFQGTLSDVDRNIVENVLRVKWDL